MTKILALLESLGFREMTHNRYVKDHVTVMWIDRLDTIFVFETVTNKRGKEQFKAVGKFHANYAQLSMKITRALQNDRRPS